MELDVDAVVAAFGRAEQNLSVHVPVALRLGADLVAAEAKANHDYTDRTKTLTESIGVDELQGSFESGDLEAIVSAGAPYALFVEMGTEPHWIDPVHRQALRWPIEGGFAFAGEVYHPGTRPYNYLANALERKLPEVVAEIEAAAELAFAEAGFEVG